MRFSAANESFNGSTRDESDDVGAGGGARAGGGLLVYEGEGGTGGGAREGGVDRGDIGGEDSTVDRFGI